MKFPSIFFVLTRFKAKYVAALPRYNPKIAAETILRAAVYPEREIYVGTVGKKAKTKVWSGNARTSYLT